MDFGFSATELDTLTGLYLSNYYAWISVAALKGVSKQIRMIATGLTNYIPSPSTLHDTVRLRRIIANGHNRSA